MGVLDAGNAPALPARAGKSPAKATGVMSLPPAKPAFRLPVARPPDPAGRGAHPRCLPPGVRAGAPWEVPLGRSLPRRDQSLLQEPPVCPRGLPPLALSSIPSRSTTGRSRISPTSSITRSGTGMNSAITSRISSSTRPARSSFSWLCDAACARCHPESASPRFIDAASFSVGLLWAVHPIHNAAVAYVAGRADSIAMMFALAGWLLFLNEGAGWRHVVALVLAPSVRAGRALREGDRVHLDRAVRDLSLRVRARHAASREARRRRLAARRPRGLSLAAAPARQPPRPAGLASSAVCRPRHPDAPGAGRLHEPHLLPRQSPHGAHGLECAGLPQPRHLAAESARGISLADRPPHHRGVRLRMLEPAAGAAKSASSG